MERQGKEAPDTAVLSTLEGGGVQRQRAGGEGSQLSGMVMWRITRHEPMEQNARGEYRPGGTKG